MDFKEIAAITTGAVTLLGFIGTWIKIGIAKGKVGFGNRCGTKICGQGRFIRLYDRRAYGRKTVAARRTDRQHKNRQRDDIVEARNEYRLDKREHR